MNYEFMITGTPLPPCMPLPRTALRLPVSSTAKVMYARLLDEILTNGIEDSNGILFIRFPSWNWRRHFPEAPRPASVP